MRRYLAEQRRGRWFTEHDTPRVTRKWVLWLLRELGIRPQYGRPRKRTHNASASWLRSQVTD